MALALKTFFLFFSVSFFFFFFFLPNHGIWNFRGQGSNPGMPWLQPELLQWHSQIINLWHHSRNSWNLNFYQGLAWLHFFLFFLSLPWMKSASSEASSLSAASPMSNTLVQLQLLWREWDTTPSKCLGMTWGTLAAVWADQLVSGWA